MYENLLLNHLAQNWGWIALRGLAAVIFGVLAFIWPGVTLGVLTLLWGAYALADGILTLVAAFRNRDRAVPVWTLILIGLAGIGAGIVTFLWPGMTAIVLLVLIAAWAVTIGVLQIVAAIRLRKEIEYEWFLGLSGVLSIKGDAHLFRIMCASPFSAFAFSAFGRNGGRPSMSDLPLVDFERAR